MTENFDKELIPFIEAVTAKKAQDIVVLDVRKMTSYTDYLILASGNSTRQVSSLAEHIKKDLSEKDQKPFSMEGHTEGQWALMDYGNVIIHIFIEESRKFYDIEGLWADAVKIPVESEPEEN